MNSVWFISATAISFLAIWVAWAKAPQWARRARINARLHRLADQNEEVSSFWLSRLASQFTESSIARGDFEDIREAYAATGRTREQAQLLYLLFCWILPAVAVAVGFVFLGPIGGMIVAALSFLVPRRAIRSMGQRAEQRQNLEAVELCHLTRMLYRAEIVMMRLLFVSLVFAFTVATSERVVLYARIPISGEQRLKRELSERSDPSSDKVRIRMRDKLSDLRMPAH